jgi:phosphoketolase
MIARQGMKELFGSYRSGGIPSHAAAETPG